jgi:hypothetical protein
MEKYTEKMENLIRYHIRDKVTGKPLSKYNVTAHHQLHNTKGNRKKYPLFIDSHSNLLPVAPGSIGADNQFVITEKTASVYEKAFTAIRELFESEDVEIMLFMYDIGSIWDKTGK